VILSVVTCLVYINLVLWWCLQEKKFTAELMASLLSIPSSKTLLRRSIMAIATFRPIHCQPPSNLTSSDLPTGAFLFVAFHPINFLSVTFLHITFHPITLSCHFLPVPFCPRTFCSVHKLHPKCRR
jgi:hypothetical protein